MTTTVTSTFNELLERAGNSFDESFKRASDSFDESFKQMQSTYDGVVLNTNPFFMSPDPARSCNSSKAENDETNQLHEEEQSLYRSFFSNDKPVEADAAPGVSQVPSWGRERSPPIAKFRDFADARQGATLSNHSRGASSKLTMASIAAASASAAVPAQDESRSAPQSQDQVDDSSEENSIVAEARQKILQHLQLQELQKQTQHEEDHCSDEDSNRPTSLDRAEKKTEAAPAANNNGSAHSNTIVDLLGYESQHTVTRIKTSRNQSVGLDFMALNTQLGTMLIVSKIEPTSIFANSGLGVGDAILRINGVAFRGNGGTVDDKTCRPDAEIAQKLLDKGWDGQQRDHRGRSSPNRGSGVEDRLQVTIEYQKFGGLSPVASPASTPSRNGKHSVALSSAHGDTYVLGNSYDEDEGLCVPECSSAAVEVVAAVTTNPVTPSKKDRQRKSIWAPARNFLKRSRTPTKGRKNQKELETPNKTSKGGKNSPPKVIHSRKSVPRAVSPINRLPSSRLAELRSKHSQIRDSSHRKIAESKKRMLSTHIERSTPQTPQQCISVSCDSPASLGMQLQQDKKVQFEKKVDSMKKELLSSVERETTSPSPMPVDTSTSDDEYKLARSQQESLISSVQNLSVISTASDIDEWPSLKETKKAATPKTSSLHSRSTALLDDASFSTLEFLEAEAERRNTAHVLGEHHQELIRLNKKVADKLRSKVDLLKRNNMKLAEEVAVLRTEDARKSEMLSSWQQQMDIRKAEREEINKEIELYKSQLRICSLQSDKRQQELRSQLERQEKKANDRSDLLLKRIGILERSNRKLMAKLQNAEKNRDMKSDLRVEARQLRNKLASQAGTMESLLDANDDLTTKNLELEKKLNECRKQKEENSSEALVAEVAICSARTQFLERQMGCCKEQLRVVKEEALHERQKRLLCQRELEDALMMLNDRAVEPKTAENASIDERNVSLQSNDSSFSIDRFNEHVRNWTGPGEEVADEKKTMESSDW
ncbi:MAG: hypothetical protein SGILL_004480 [Bacillariaceae sp.]